MELCLLQNEGNGILTFVVACLHPPRGTQISNSSDFGTFQLEQNENSWLDV